jgi:hypothetical protein
MQLRAMRERQLPQHSFSPRRKSQQNLTAIVAAAIAPHPMIRLEAVEELDGAVMLDQQAPGQLTDRRFLSRRQPLQRLERLILLRLQPGGPRCLLAEVQRMT